MTSLDAGIAEPAHLPRLLSLAPGLALTAAIAGAAFALRLVPGVATLSPMILAVLLGVVLHNLFGAPKAAREGVAFSLRFVLRSSIILLGLQITAGQAAALGVGGLAAIAVALVSTLAFTILIGRALGVSRGLALLIGVGTSICGASAVLAAKAATAGDDEDAAYAVACVTVFGTLAMFAYPLAQSFLHLSPRAYGLWAGSSIHEIAQAVAAAFQGGGDAGQFGTIAKLTRVAMMAPVVIVLGEMSGRLGLVGEGERRRPPFPWFLIGFLALAALNSLVAIPHEIAAPIGVGASFLLSMAMAAMGLHTDLRHIRSRGLGPLALGLLASLFICGFSLVMVRLIP
ncbi:MAG: putative sulfate exporter family transporter [Roseiarcus sp.]|jgi:uncharacterized integral membrane protein (TIGR00698 family)|uniref:YeiH family protein n=1 Tax=Roseiarcus sp. TaxID=1969460 RepID=UPI003C26DA3D